jgi:putative phosphoribosyl transferase
MLTDIPQLRDKSRVFKDRFDAGCKLAEMCSAYKDGPAIILALPAGGVPVAAAMAEKLNLPLDTAVVSKITLPWNTETGFGAVAFDGTVLLNEQFLKSLHLSEEQVKQRIQMTCEKVTGRTKQFRTGRHFPELEDRPVFLVDDGIASGFTMQTAIKAIKNLKANEIIVAVPTAHSESLTPLIAMVDAIYCANIRHGYSFAVADAYKNWSDVDEVEAFEILNRFK